MVNIRPAVLAGAEDVLVGTLVALTVFFAMVAVLGVLRTVSRCVLGAVGRGAGVTGAGIVDTGAAVLVLLVVDEREGAAVGMTARDGAGATGPELTLVEGRLAGGTVGGAATGATAGVVGALAVVDPAAHCRP
jgi:hypothetical protein